MLDLAMHHVSVPSSDLDRSAAFYEGVLGLTRLTRPPFTIPGIWYRVGDRQIHVTLNTAAHFRTGKGVDNDDIHFAMSVNDFDAACEHLQALGYAEDLPVLDPKRMILKKTGLAGFPQMFIMDPDRNIIEINRAPFITS
jgi:glyoxylase I family protein